MKNIMLDLETLSTAPDAHILSIGAVMFDESGLGSEFYTVIDINSDQRGAVIDPSTVQWWSGQSDEARKVFTEPRAVDFTNALNAFADFCYRVEGALVWGNGADFDNVIISRAYARAGILRPWKTYNSRCYRTLKSIAPNIKLERNGTHHNALDDAKTQARHAVSILRFLDQD